MDELGTADEFFLLGEGFVGIVEDIWPEKAAEV